MENNKTLSRKEREREFRRQEILSAALELVAQKGIEHTTLDEIAEASEFGKGTLYNYFQNKEDIYSAILESIYTIHIEHLRKLDSETETFHEFLSKLCEGLFQYYVQNRNVFILLLNLRLQKKENIEPLLSDFMKKMHEEGDEIHLRRVKEAIKKGEIGNGDPLKISMLYRGLFFSYAFSLMNCEKTKELDPAEDAKFLVDFIMNGLKKGNNTE